MFYGCFKTKSMFEPLRAMDQCSALICFEEKTSVTLPMTPNQEEMETLL